MLDRGYFRNLAQSLKFKNGLAQTRAELSTLILFSNDLFEKYLRMKIQTRKIFKVFIINENLKIS